MSNGTDLEDFKRRLLCDDDLVLSEVRRIQELFVLKNEIRWAQTRLDSNLTESVAEHVYGMHIVADYFLPIEDSEGMLNRERIHDMITWHDIDEIETGDILSLEKQQTRNNDELRAARNVISRMPKHMQNRVTSILKEYNEKVTPEALFVKAIDKAEPIFEIYRDGFDAVLKSINRREDHWDQIITHYVKQYPYIVRFTNLVRQWASADGFFAR